MKNGKTNKKTKVLAFGTFDLLHPGHVLFLQKASEYGEMLVVVVARDRTVKEIKGSLPEDDESLRAENVKRLGFVDEVLLGNEDSRKFETIKQVKPDVICLGYDQRSFTEGLEKRLKSMGIKSRIVRLGPFRPEKFKTSIIKNIKRKKGKDDHGKRCNG